MTEAENNMLEGNDKGGPHLRSHLTVNRFMLIVLASVMPVFVSAVCFAGWRALAMLAAACAGGGIVEGAFCAFRKQKPDISLAVSCIFFALVLPSSVPLWMAAMGMAFGIFFGKSVFGGTGHNLFNPALLGRCFLLLGYPAAMTKALLGAGGGSENTIGSALTMIFGQTAGWTGWVIMALILIGAVVTALTVANWRIMFAVIISGLATAGVLWLAGRTGGAGAKLMQIVLSPGFVFGVCFMATDPVTAPNTNAGRWIYGVIVGVLAVVITVYATYYEGMMFGILLGNVFAPTIDSAVLAIRYRRVSR